MIRTGAAADAIRSRTRLRIVAVASAFFLNGLAFGQWAARIPAVQTQTNLDKASLGLALLAAAFGGILVMPVGGWLGSRVGTHNMTALTLLGCAAMLPILAAANGFLWLAAGLFLWGAAQGPMDVCMNANGLAVERRLETGPIMSRLHGTWSIGSFAGASVTAGAVSLGVSLQVQFAVLAALLASGAVFLRITMLPDRHAESGSFRLPPRQLVGLGFLAFCGLVAEGAASDWSALYMRDGLGAADNVGALTLAVFAGSMAIARLLGDRMTVTLGPRGLVSGGAALAAAGLGAALLVPVTPVAIAGFGLMGAGVAAVVPVLFRAGGSQPGIPAAIGIAAVSTMGYAGGLSGPPIIGAVASASSLRLALAIIVAMLVVLSIGSRTALRGELRVPEPAVPEELPS